MGLGDFLKSASGKLEKLNGESLEWKAKLSDKSDEELRQIAKTGSPTAKRLGAAALLKDRGY